MSVMNDVHGKGVLDNIAHALGNKGLLSDIGLNFRQYTMSWRAERLNLDKETFNIIHNRICRLEERVGGLKALSGVEKDHRPSGVGELSSMSYINYRTKLTGLDVLRCHIEDFWNNISLPGFKYVGEPRRHRSERYIWIVVLVLSLFVSTKYIGDAYKKWQGSPVLLSFNDSLTPIALIPFPAITLCPARRLAPTLNLQDTLEYCQANNCSQKETDLMSAAHLFCPKSKYFNSEAMNEVSYNSSLDKALKEVAIRCEDVFEWFKFSKDEYMNVIENRSLCSKSLQTLYGDGSNVCFTFNMLPASAMFKKDVIPPVVDETELATKSEWSPDGMLKAADLETSVPRYIDSNGRWSGFFIGISNFIANQSDICGEEAAAAKMFIHHPAELPMSQTHESVEILAHKELFVRLYPTVVAASQELDDYTPLNRRCYFSHERPLALFTTYTQRNCQLECRVNCSLSVCDCVPFYLPRINSSVRICGKDHRKSCSSILITGNLEGRFTWRDILWQFRNNTGRPTQERFQEYESKYQKGKKLPQTFEQPPFPECACDCPAACTSLGYGLKLEDGYSLDTSDSHQFSKVAVSFKELEVTSVLRKELIGITDFIANSGGVLGVFTGFSFLALCELVYYLTLRLWNTIKHAWEYDGICSPKTSTLKRQDRFRCCFSSVPK